MSASQFHPSSAFLPADALAAPLTLIGAAFFPEFV